jgi:hypothetical protein
MLKTLHCLCWLLAMTVLSNNAYVENFAFKSMEEVSRKLQSILRTKEPGKVLIAFDVDMTLTQPDHPATYYPALKKHWKIYQEIMSGLTSEQKDLVLTLTLYLPQRLVEDLIPKLVETLKSEGPKVIAFTNSLSGCWEDSTHKHIFARRDTLLSMGIDFAGQFPDVISFINFPIYTNGYPIFYHGILSANGQYQGVGKGPVLGAFLQHVEDLKGHPFDSGYYYSYR